MQNYATLPSVELLAEQGISALQLGGATGKVSLSTVAVTGQPFTKALRAEVKEPSQQSWDVQLQTPTRSAVEKGDVLLASFYFRTEWVAAESGEGQTEFVFELAREPWTKSVSYPVRASRDWKKVYVPFVAAESHAAGAAQVILRLGYMPETIEIADVRVENFQKQLALADLPTTKISYRGMEPDAPWRAEAQQRIEKLRKAELELVVRDARGKPVPEAQVSLKLETHAFQFGTCVAADRLLKPGNDRYQSVVKEHFNYATIENSLKWVALEGDWGSDFSLEIAQGAIRWLRDAGIAVRGHVLVWPGWGNLPKSLRAYEKQPDELRRRVRQHVRELATETRGSLVHWDVLNEPFDNHDLMDILGKQEMVEWFKIARAADPTAKLFINDYAILSGGGGESPHRAHYEETIRYLVENGAPLDGIGFQGHFGSSLTAPDDLLTLLDRYAKFDKQLMVTEYDLVIADEELQARYTEDFYTLLFSHPRVTGIVMWGFWDPAHWKKNATMFREDWSLKPAGKVFSELVHRRWHTEASGVTDATGSYVARGFLGKYAISVSMPGKSKTLTASLEPGGTSLSVKLD